MPNRSYTCNHKQQANVEQHLIAAGSCLVASVGYCPLGKHNNLPVVDNIIMIEVMYYCNLRTYQDKRYKTS